MTRHVFTQEESRKGGWGRCRQWAEDRRRRPSKAETAARQTCDRLGLVFVPESEFVNLEGRPQFFDLLVTVPVTFAVEVDGSHGWHGSCDSSKMKALDDEKRSYCESVGLPLLVLKGKAETFENKIKKFLEGFEPLPIPVDLKEAVLV